MAKMKQMHLDIIESQEPDEDGFVFAIPTPVPSPALEVANAEVSAD